MNIQEKQLATELQTRKMERMHEYACAALAGTLANTDNFYTLVEAAGSAWTIAEALENEFQKRFPDAEQAPRINL